MPFGQKKVVNKSKKKIDKKNIIGKNVRVTKHFQPELIYHNENFERDFPEVNSDVDIVESLRNIKTPNMKIESSKNSFYKPSSIAKTHTSNNITPNNLHQKILPPSPLFQKYNFKSVSCVEDRTSLYGQMYKSLKSKSFVEAGTQNIKISPLTSDLKSIISEDVIVPRSTQAESPLDRLKKEIIINRIEGFRSFSSCSERKEKMEKIRRELSLLIHSPNAEQQIVENEERPFVKAYKPMLIYNVNEVRNSSLHSDKVLPIVLENQRIENESQRLEEKETQNSAVSTPRYIEDGTAEKSTCSHHTTSDESIRQKIETANTLIKKVKTALDDIRKEKKNYISEDTTDNEHEHVSSECGCGNILQIKRTSKEPQNNPETKCCNVTSPALLVIKQIVTELERPKTRRLETHDEPYVLEKYRTEPKDLAMPDDSDYDILNTKLNVISESAESDMSKDSLPKEHLQTTEKDPLVSVFTNTDPILQDVKAVQVKPTSSVVSTQSEVLLTTDHSVQTDMPPNDDISTKQADEYQKKLSLEVQILPQINIPSSFVVQKVLEFSINQKGDTELSYKADIPTVSFVEITSSKMDFADTDLDCSAPEKKKSTVRINADRIKWLESLEAKNGSGTSKGEESTSSKETFEVVKPSHRPFRDSVAVIKKHKFREGEIGEKKNRGKVPRASLTKELILRSYHVFDNENHHDPGSLNESSLLIDDIDESVYKTFINPLGILRRSGPTSSSFITKDKSSSDVTKDTSPKVYNIGLYKTAETQYEPPTEISDADNTDKYEVISFSLTSSTETSDTESEHNKSAKSDSQCSKIDFSYKPENQAVLRQLRHKIEQKCPEKNKDYNIYEQFSDSHKDSSLSVPEYICDIMSHPKDTLKKVIPIIRGTVKQCASISSDENFEKISEKNSHPKCLLKAHKRTLATNLTVSEHTTVDEHQISKSKPASKLETEQKPTIDSVNDNFLSQEYTLNEEEPINDEDYENEGEDASSEEDGNKKFTVMNVHVHGDSIPLKSHPIHINALEVAKNGRYKDEANLFCENRNEEHSDNSPRERLEDVSLHCKEQIFQSSNSETITSKTLSRGEIKCNCSVSSGEVHFHNGNSFSDKRLKNLPHSKKKTYAVKKRTYFSNWVTYFVKNDNFVNDSSWSSSNK